MNDNEELERRLRDLASMADDVQVPSGATLRARGKRRAERRKFLTVAACAFVIAAAISSVALLQAAPTHTVPARRPSTTSTTAPTVATTLPGATTTTTTAPITATTAPTTPTGTQDILYNGFTPTGIDPNLQVTDHVSGTCLRYGGGVDGQYRYRCFTPDIYDPCFAGPQGTAAPLVCPTDPATADVVELTVTSITGTDPPTSTAQPWAMQLSSGQVCLLVSAAWGGLGPYQCQSSSTQPSFADCHQPASAHPFWAADCQDQQTTSSPFTSIEVAKVWF